MAIEENCLEMSGLARAGTRLARAKTLRAADMLLA